MLCDDCGEREATFNSIKKINGHVQESHLCSECFHKRGGTFGGGIFGGFPDPWNLGGLMSGLNGFFNPTRALPNDDYICPSCGTTGDEFLKSGYVGCADCYKEFAPIIMPVIKRMQGDVIHLGKSPNGIENSVSDEYARLTRELQRAKDSEDFERAQEIKERIEKLKGEGL